VVPGGFERSEHVLRHLCVLGAAELAVIRTDTCGQGFDP
jgi:hypothetical protein